MRFRVLCYSNFRRSISIRAQELKSSFEIKTKTAVKLLPRDSEIMNVHSGCNEYLMPALSLRLLLHSRDIFFFYVYVRSFMQMDSGRERNRARLRTK